MAEITIDISGLFADTGTAKLDKLPEYLDRVLQEAGSGTTVVLTGPGPVWLYLKIAHALHGRARTLIYDPPVTGRVTVFDHDPF